MRSTLTRIPTTLLMLVALALAPTARAWAEPSITPQNDADPVAAVTVLSGAERDAVMGGGGSSGVHTAGIVFTAVGGVVLLAGFTTTLATLVYWGQMESATTLDERRDAADTVDVLAPTSDGLLLGGAVMLLAGVLMMQLGSSSGVAAGPAIGPDQIGMNMRVTW